MKPVGSSAVNTNSVLDLLTVRYIRFLYLYAATEIDERSMYTSRAVRDTCIVQYGSY